MVNRRSFLKFFGISSTAALGVTAVSSQAQSASSGLYYELRTYQLETEAQKAGFEQFMADAMIPALNRLGVSPVGVFLTPDAVGPAYVLLPYADAAAYAQTTQALLKDADFLAKGAAFLDAPASAPAYTRMESTLLAAFAGMPKLERPVTSPGRVFQLRTYESPSIKTGQKKIEMFNKGEIAIFRKTGLNPVFFGEALIGGKMPNLTYMLSFESLDAQKTAWDTFKTDPDWLEIKAIPAYADDAILCGITNLSLLPAVCSQV